MVELAFFAGAIGAIGGAVGVVALRNPFYSNGKEPPDRYFW